VDARERDAGQGVDLGIREAVALRAGIVEHGARLVQDDGARLRRAVGIARADVRVPGQRLARPGEGLVDGTPDRARIAAGMHPPFRLPADDVAPSRREAPALGRLVETDAELAGVGLDGGADDRLPFREVGRLEVVAPDDRPALVPRPHCHLPRGS